MELLTGMTRFWKYSMIAIVLYVALSAYETNQSGSKDTVSYSFLKTASVAASKSCGQYFDSIEEFAESRASDSATEQLKRSLNSMTGELVEVNSAVGLMVTNESTRKSNLQMVKTIQNIEVTMEKAEAFLKTTVKTECEKWRRFSTFSVEQVQSYVNRDFSAIVQKTSSSLCSSAKSELKLLDTKKLFDVLQCGAEEFEGGLTLFMVLSDWLKSDWIKTMDIESAPSKEDLDEWLFDIPIQIMSKALTGSGLDPIVFDSMMIAFEDDNQTVYEIKPDDFSLALQAPTTNETVSILRDKMLITGS